ncbi:MAG TPA: hypothetical protein VGV61_06440 [Thermoanaerobaculia bacterium]|jgi:hypothetical protein|nr:hypothetical protein [Thermoanaerobaculia bacterium]
MNAQKYCAISALVFTVVAAAHLLRALGGAALQVGSWQVPLALSWAAAAVGGTLAVWGFRLATRSSG